MSGRAKHAPADPAAEREQMRQLTRELHEAAQHAADERRALLAAKTQIAESAAVVARQIVDEQHQALSDYFDAQWARLQEIITTAEVKIREGFTAEMAAAGATDVVLRTCGMILHLTDTSLSLDEWVNSLKDIAAMHTVTGCTCLGCLAITRAQTGTWNPPPRSARRPHGVLGGAAALAAAGAAEIIVTTPDGLKAYEASGGRSPDLIIDAR